jgi:protein-disulfide isomerase
MDQEMHKLTKRERKLLRKEEKLRMKVESTKKWSVTKIASWTLAGVATLVTLFGFYKLATRPVPPVMGPSTVEATDHVRWSTSSATLLIEYSDFQCPACAFYHGILKQLETDYASKVQLVYRHYPLRQNHKNADLAARVAEAAALQGKFWEMHDLLFDSQTAWGESGNPMEYFNAYADKLGLEKKKFTDTIETDVVKTRVQKDVDSGDVARIDATPSFFLNGKLLDNVRNLEDFKARLNEEIAKVPTSIASISPSVSVNATGGGEIN